MNNNDVVRMFGEEVKKADLKEYLGSKTVSELKELTKSNGLKVTKDGGSKKMNKSDLIEQLVCFYNNNKEAEVEVKEVKEESVEEVKNIDDVMKEEPIIVEVEENKVIKFAKTAEEIEQKYHKRKKDEIYNNELVPDSFVVFFLDVKAKDGNVYRKLRTAKVIGVNRKRELVKVQTLFGDIITLTYDELLYIRKNENQCTYPCDIVCYLRNQRMESRERFNKRKAVENEENEAW